MELSNILVGIEGIKARGTLDKQINKIECNSSNTTEGDLFIAIEGFNVDGHLYIFDAISNGATAVMLQSNKITKELIEKIPNEVTVIVAENTRYAMSICACNFYKNPSKKFKLIGVTGTKGKTTTTFMIKSILEQQGYKVRVNWNNMHICWK